MSANNRHNDLQRQKSVATTCQLTLKYSLFFINVIVWLIGISLLVAGIYAKVNKDLNSLDGTLPWYMDPANMFIIFGCIVFLLTFIGCIGVIRENRVLLDVFIYILLFIMFVELVLVIYVSVDRSRVKNNVEKLLLKTVPKYRDDTDLQNIMDYVQERVSCCGVKTYNDWENNIYFNCSSPGVEACGVPYSCCRDVLKELNTQCGFGVRHPSVTTLNVTSAIYTSGCVDETIERFFTGTNLTLIITLGSLAFIMQCTTVVMTIMMRNRILDALEKWRHDPSRPGHEHGHYRDNKGRRFVLWRGSQPNRTPHFSGEARR